MRELVSVHVSRILESDDGYKNMHPSLVAFLDIIHAPRFPSSAHSFIFGDGCRRLFEINDAVRPGCRRALMNDDFEMRVINILNGIFG